MIWSEVIDRRPLSVYLASGFFREDEIEIVDHLEKLLPEWGLDVYSPRRDSPQLNKDDPESRKKTFLADIKGISNSQVLLTPRITAPHDDGTMWEMGYAYKADYIRIIVYHLPSAPSNFNLMPALSSFIHCYSEEDLKEALEKSKRVNFGEHVENLRFLREKFPFKGELY